MEEDQMPFSHMLISKDTQLNIMGSCLDNNINTPQGVHEELEGRLSSGDRYGDTHEGKEKYDGDIMLHANEPNTLLIKESIADIVPKEEPNEMDTISFITNQERSHLEGLVKEKLRDISLSNNMHIEEYLGINVPYMQDQCLMIT